MSPASPDGSRPAQGCARRRSGLASSSTRALLEEGRVAARYASLGKQRRNAALAHPRSAAELVEDVSFELEPLAVWAALSADARRGKVEALIDEIERQHRGESFLGARAVRAQSPNCTPRRSKRSPMPRCHASTAATHRRYASAYREFPERMRHLRAASRTESHRLYPPGTWPGRVGTSRPPRTSSFPGRSALPTPTNSSSRPEKSALAPFALMRHRQPLPSRQRLVAQESPCGGQAVGAAGFR